MLSRRPNALLALLASALAACASARDAERRSAADELAGGAPPVRVEAELLAAERDAACARIAPLQLDDPAAAALSAGMLEPDLQALRAATRRLELTVTFRQGNPACLPHLAKGVQSKPHWILQKTWNADSLDADHQHLAGLVSNLREKPPRGTVVADPQLTLENGEPVTCDYDLMDVLDARGGRIPGESERDLATRAALNAALPDTPQGHRNRILHGSQSEYPRYAALHPDEPVIRGILEPEAPLTAIDDSGRVFRLPKLEDALNFYFCRGARIPEHWNVVAADREGHRRPVRGPRAAGAHWPAVDRANATSTSPAPAHTPPAAAPASR